MMDKNQIKQFILSLVKPLKSGKIFSQQSGKVTLTDIYPEGTNQNVRDTSPFGLVAKAPVGVTAFYQNLFGSGHESILIALLHALRPEPSGVGEVILYSTDSNGAVKVKFTLKSDGSLTIDVPSTVTLTSGGKTSIIASRVDIVAPIVNVASGTLEKVVNGETFLAFFNEHVHYDSFGLPTSPPTEPMVEATHLSAKVKAAK